MADESEDAVILIVRAQGAEIGRVRRDQLPIELKPSVPVEGSARISFEDGAGATHVHDLPDVAGWCHLSVRVHPNLSCQADCVVTDREAFDPEPFRRGEARGYRMQPFFLAGAQVDPATFRGRGLFARGLHFSGSITPGNVYLSCECDACRRSFVARSFHAGFSMAAYMYSDSGRHTIVIEGGVPGAPLPLSDPDLAAVAQLEQRLPLAPDGSGFKYMNPFRCPHCRAAYVDFEAHPGEREREYYGLYLPGSDLMHFPAR